MDGMVYGVDASHLPNCLHPGAGRPRERTDYWTQLAVNIPGSMAMPNQERMVATAVVPGFMMESRFGPDLTQTMSPSDIFNTRNHGGNGLGFGNHFDSSAFMAASSASFGSMTWPAPSMQHSPQVAFRQNHTIFRNESYSSTASDPYIKPEEDMIFDAPPFGFNAEFYDSSPESSSSAGSTDEQKPVVFKTEIDTLMSTIQSHEQQSRKQRTSQAEPEAPDTSLPSRQKKRYACAVPGCNKAFCQKTHLDIHTRAHTGVKPFSCSEPSCGQRFSQLGNLRTHERRHTGERPYACEICGKQFAQHGNVKSHQNIHKGTKPFVCKLDDCGKTFTQLGNLKSHQNKFHADTIRRLKHRFSTIRSGETVEAWEAELWQYFSGLYKNCNKGIKGRGKDRRITSTVGMHPGVTRSNTADEHAGHSEGERQVGTLAEEVARRIAG